MCCLTEVLTSLCTACAVTTSPDLGPRVELPRADVVLVVGNKNSVSLQGLPYKVTQTAGVRGDG